MAISVAQHKEITDLLQMKIDIFQQMIDRERENGRRWKKKFDVAVKSRNARVFAAQNITQKLSTVVSTLGDTGATDLLLRKCDAVATGIDMTKIGDGGFGVMLPNNSIIRSIGEAVVNIPPTNIDLKAHIFADKDLARSLTSISDLTNAPNFCDVLFNFLRCVIHSWRRFRHSK